jgi:hypothetical protein
MLQVLVLSLKIFTAEEKHGPCKSYSQKKERIEKNGQVSE